MRPAHSAEGLDVSGSQGLLIMSRSVEVYVSGLKGKEMNLSLECYCLGQLGKEL
jgi:hypothetical protein